MGRFENRPENPRARGDISRAAENALWGVVEDLQSVQQNMLKSLQEDVDKLDREKKRLADDIKQLQSQKEQLQQTKQITEQQALVRQLAQVLANHISSQLQSSLSVLAKQAMESDLNETNKEKAIASHETNTNIVTEVNKNTEQLIGSLDDTLTITLKLLQQELNNHQSGISQQLQRMQTQQQQGEAKLVELTNRLDKELEKRTPATPQVPLTAAAVTPQQNQESVKNTTQTHAEAKKEPISVIPIQVSNTEKLPKSPVTPPEAKKNPSEPISVIPIQVSNTEKLPKSPVTQRESNSIHPIETSNKVTSSAPLEAKKDPKEPISVIPIEVSNKFSAPSTPLEAKKNPSESNSIHSIEASNKVNTSSTPLEAKKNPSESNSIHSIEASNKVNTSSTPPEAKKNPSESNSIHSIEASNKVNTSSTTEAKENPKEPISVNPTQVSNSETKQAISPVTPRENKKDPKEPISVLSRELSENTLNSSPPPESAKSKLPEVKKDPKEPISVLAKDAGTTKSPPFGQPQQERMPRQTASNGAFGLSPMQIGLLLIALSTVLSSLYNVAIRGIFQPNIQVLGAFQVEPLISPTLGNSLLILMLRMMVVVPLMLMLAPMMHQRVWLDLQNLADSVRGNTSPTKANTRRVLILSVVSGCFLFLSQVLIYLAIGQIPTGMAIALFFVYPMISGLLSWFLFREQPSFIRMSAIASIFFGELLVLSGSALAEIGNNPNGSISAIASGISFAIYVILTRICAPKLHPVTFTLINFATMLFLCFISLMLPLPNTWSLVIDPNRFLELILSAFILGVMTLGAYVLNNIGISKFGAMRASIFAASVPVLTVIFAGLIIQESLQIIQVFGVLLITFGAAAFSLERIRPSS